MSNPPAPQPEAPAQANARTGDTQLADARTGDAQTGDTQSADARTGDAQPGGVPPQHIPGQPPAPPPPYPPAKKKSKAARRKRRRKAIKTTITLLILVIVIGGIAGGMYWLFTREKPVEYAKETVYRSMLETAVQGWGYIRPVESSDIAVRQRAMVKESYYNMGDMVFEGDLLFLLDSGELDDQIEGLRLRIDDIDKKIDKANDEIRSLRGDEAERRANLTVTTPFRGQLIEASYLKAGDYVTIGDRVGILVDNVNLTLALYFSYAYEDDIYIGQAADVSVPATMSVIRGNVSAINKVRRISAEGTMLFEVEITIVNPGALTAGMAAGAVIPSAEEEIYPYEAGALDYTRYEPLVVKAPGRLTYINVVNYMDYDAGETLCSIEYREDNSQVELLLAQIKAFNEEIEGIEVEIELVMQEYENLYVTAPISGTVMYNNLFPGMMAEPGYAVFSIAKLDKMMVEAQVDERQVSQVRPGMPVEITIWSMDGQMILPGTVKSVNMTPADSMNYGGSVVYYPAVFEMENYGGMLMSGQGVDYRLIVEQKFDILVAPVIAVKNTDQGTCVFVWSEDRPDNAIDLEDGIVPPGFYAVPVVCGIGNENGIEIISGIEEGAVVFTQIIPLDEMNQGIRGGVYYG